MEKIRSNVRSSLHMRDFPLVVLVVFLLLLIYTNYVVWAILACLGVTTLLVILTTPEDINNAKHGVYSPPTATAQKITKEDEPSPEPLTFQQKRDQLKKDKDSKEVYGAKNLKKDFKKTLQKILPIVNPPKEEDPKERGITKLIIIKLLIMIK